MPVLLGIVASLFIGFSDTFGRASAKRADAVSHVATQMIIGVAATMPLALVLGHELLGPDLVAGAASGVSIAVGLSILYRAMADSSSSIAAPIAAVMAALVPLAWDLIGGAELEPLALVGCVVALASMALCSVNNRLGAAARTGVIMAIAGGLFLGLAVALAADTAEASGVWPAVAQRFTGFLAMVAVALRRGVAPVLPPGVRRFGVGGGIAGGVGMAAWVLGAQLGDLGTVSVVASTYPAVVVVLATTFDGDEIRWWQALGIAGAILGTVLIALT